MVETAAFIADANARDLAKRRGDALPEKPAASPAAKPEKQAASTDVTEPVSEPAEEDYVGIKPKTKARMAELLAERKAADERASRAERRIAELEARTHQPIEATQPAAPPTAKADDDPKPNKADEKKYPDGQFDEQFMEDMAAWVNRRELKAARLKADEARQVERSADEDRQVRQEFGTRAEQAKAKYADFEAVAFKPWTDPSAAILPGSVADRFIWRSKSGAHVLYHLQQPANAGELRRIMALPDVQQLEELAILGHRLTADDPVPSSTKAPDPPHVLGTRPAPRDPVERALSEGDSEDATRRQMDALNRRDIARMKR